MRKLLEKRLSSYSEGLDFVLQVENKRSDIITLETFLAKFSTWFASNCGYLSPKTVELFSDLLWEIRSYSISLANSALTPDDYSRIGTKGKELEEWLKEKKELMDIPDSMK